MSALRYEIRLRAGPTPDDPIECSHQAPQAEQWSDWFSTGLTERKQLTDGVGTLGDLIGLFARLDPELDGIEGLQYELRDADQHSAGRLLHRGLFGTRLPVYGGSWLHLVPVRREGISEDDEERFRAFVLRVPWALLTESDSGRAPFLALRDGDPCAITIQADFEESHGLLRQVKLPRYPNVLLIFPTADPEDSVEQDLDKTQGNAHRREIKKALLAQYEPSGKHRIRTVRTFQELKTVLTGAASGLKTEPGPPFDPHIIYFYGHGQSQDGITFLEFAPEAGTKPESKHVGEVTALLRRLVSRLSFPPVIWINSCQGAAAPRDNVIKEFAPFASAVIAMRTLAVVEDSRSLALAALPRIAVDGRAPPMALAHAIQALAEGPFDTVQSARWATAAVAVQYELWSPLALEDRKVEERESAGDIPIRLDRTEALRAIEGRFNGFLAETEPDAPIAITWHGEDDDGLDIFEQRFVDFVAEAFPNWGARDFRVELQAELGLKDESASSESFAASVFLALRQLPPGSTIGQVDFMKLARIFASLASEQPTLVTFRHGPLTRSHCDHVLNYLKFWGELHSQLRIRSDRTRIVLGFRFHDRGGPVFPEGQGPKAPIALGAVSIDDLVKHLETFSRFYRLGAGEASAKAEADALVSRRGSMYRPLIFALQEKLGLYLWTKDETRTGEP